MLRILPEKGREIQCSRKHNKKKQKNGFKSMSNNVYVGRLPCR